jgi:hypothetical protein
MFNENQISSAIKAETAKENVQEFENSVFSLVPKDSDNKEQDLKKEKAQEAIIPEQNLLNEDTTKLTESVNKETENLDSGITQQSEDLENSINEKLVEAGLAVEYWGGTKVKVWGDY